VVAAGGGDGAVAVQAQQADGQAAQRCHHAGRVPGPDQGLVFLVGDVADPVKTVSRLPVPADPGCQCGRAGVAVAGDQVDGLDGLLALLGDRAAQLRDLGGAAGSDPGRGQRGLDGAAAIPSASSPASACRRPRLLRGSGTWDSRPGRYRTRAAAGIKEDVMSGRESFGADDGECENFHRSARAPPASRRHARHISLNYDTAGHSLTSRLCRVPAGRPRGVTVAMFRRTDLGMLICRIAGIGNCAALWTGAGG
jgi:hypothetical protein